LVEHCAVGELPPPVRETALHPATAAPLSKKPTEPVGAFPVTVAVKTSVVPAGAGFVDVASETFVAMPLIV